MASRINSLTLDDRAPYRRLTQFRVQAPAHVSMLPVSAPRCILGLPARTPVLTAVSRRPDAGFEAQLDAA
ncbi:MAG: hypothetical protein ABIX28_19405 [Vicinamibacterales bacterium]